MILSGDVNLKAALTLPLIRVLLEAVPDAILVVDGEGHIVHANTHVNALFGTASEELIGAPLEVLLPERFHGIHADHRARYFDAPQRRDMGSRDVAIFGRRRDGTEFPAEISLSPLALEHLTYVIAAVRDITARRQVEEALRWAAVQEQIIKAQETRLRELSTPLIPVSDGVVVMPLIGLIDESRTAQLMERLLKGIAAARVRMAILDVTGVPELDANAAQALLAAVSAARLLGAEVVLTGINPAVARALVELGADFGRVVTRGTLKDGIGYALSRER